MNALHRDPSLTSNDLETPANIAHENDVHSGIN
jgi:hypothetical protein